MNLCCIVSFFCHLQVVYTQNIILAIVAEAYEEAKAKLGTAETSFLMLVLMRILFTALFIVYRIRMFFRDCVYACSGWSGSSGRMPSFARSDTLNSGGAAAAYTSSPRAHHHHGPDGGSGGAGGSAAAPSAADAGGHNGSNNGYVAWNETSQWGGEVADDNIVPLAPTTSRAVLPADVEWGLAGGSASNNNSNAMFGSTISLLGSGGRTSSQYAPAQEGAAAEAAAAAAGEDATEAPMTADRAASHRPSSFDGVSRTLTNSASRARFGRSPPKGFRQRLSRVWHEVILGETHILRMYKDLSPGQVGMGAWKAGGDAAGQLA